MKGLAASAFTTWLALIALQALAGKGSASRVSQAFADVDRLLERALDPTVPAIPDRRAGATTSTKPIPRPRLPIPGQLLPV